MPEAAHGAFRDHFQEEIRVKRNLARLMVITLAPLLMALASDRAEAQSPAYETIKNIVYESWDGTSLLMDVDIPKNQGPGPFPAIVAIHGGGWYTGSRTGVEGSREAGRGYVIVRIDYRLSGTWKFPEAIRDVKCAIRFIKKHAASYKIDPNRIGIMGNSAGGHLAVLAGVSFGDSYLEGVRGYFDVDSSVKAIVAISPPTDMSQIYNHPSQGCEPIDTNSVFTIFGQYFGAPLSTIPFQVGRANPIKYVNAGDPPLFLVHGNLDCVVPFNQSELLANAYRAKGLDFTFYIYYQKGHTISMYSRTGLIAAIRSFLDTRLKNAPGS
jgi:acetyl esterase/lipase